MAKVKNIALPIRGLDTSGVAQYLDERATPDCQNIRISRTEIKKREGRSSMGSSTTGDILAYPEFEREQLQELCRITTRKFAVWDNSGVSWIDKTGSDLSGSDDDPVDWTIAKISGKSILTFTNFVDNIRKFISVADGDSSDLGGSPPKAKYLNYLYGYLLLGYIQDGADYYPERIQWSDTDDPETWSGGNSGYIDLEDGSPITGVRRIADMVVVSKDGSIWNGYLTDDSRIFDFDRVVPDMGFLVGNTIQPQPGTKLIGLGRHGIITYNGRQAQIVAGGVMEDIKQNVDPSYYMKSFGILVTRLNEYWLLVPTSGQYPNIIYKYNYLTQQVFKDTVSNITALGLRTALQPTTWDFYSAGTTWDSMTGSWDDILRTSLYPTVIFGDKDGLSTKYDFDVKNDNGTAIDAYWASKDYFLEEGLYTRWHRLEFWAYGDKVDVYYSTDEGETWTLFPSGNVTLNSSLTKHTLYFDPLSEKARIKFANSDSDSTFALRNFTLWGVKREQM